VAFGRKSCEDLVSQRASRRWPHIDIDRIVARKTMNESARRFAEIILRD
jgi:hypothetical protein